MKLFDIPNESKIMCKCSDGSNYVIFKHIDGMYSLCITEKANIVHLFCGTELTQQEDQLYIIKE
jgi:hypothetical protein